MDVTFSQGPFGRTLTTSGASVEEVIQLMFVMDNPDALRDVFGETLAGGEEEEEDGRAKVGHTVLGDLSPEEWPAGIRRLRRVDSPRGSDLLVSQDQLRAWWVDREESSDFSGSEGWWILNDGQPWAPVGDGPYEVTEVWAA